MTYVGVPEIIIILPIEALKQRAWFYLSVMRLL